MLLWFEWGLMLNPGDIRKVWLGGISFWCSPPCSHPPNPETNLGCRNLGTDVDLILRWGGVLGWVICRNSICSQGSWWFCLRVVSFMLYRGLGRLFLHYLWTYENWKHHIRSMGHNLQCWRSANQSMLSKECRGKMVKSTFGVFGSMGWDMWKQKTCKSKAKDFMAVSVEDVKSWLTYSKRDVLLIKMRSWLMLRDLFLSSEHRYGTEENWRHHDVVLHWMKKSSRFHCKNRDNLVLFQLSNTTKLCIAFLHMQVRLLKWFLQSTTWIEVLLGLWPRSPSLWSGCSLINACCEGPGWDRMKCRICNSRIKGYLYSGAMCLEHWFQRCKVVLLINLCKGPLLWGRSLVLAAIHGTEKSWWQQGVLLYCALRSSSLYSKRKGISVISQQYKAKLLWSAILYKYDRLLDWLLQNSSWIKVLLSPWIGPMTTSFQLQNPIIGGNNFSELVWTHLCSRFFYIERGILVMLQSIKVKKLCYASLCNYTKSLEWPLQNKSCVDVLRGLWSGFECSSFQLLSVVFDYCKPSELKFVWYPSVWSGYVRQHLHRFSHKGPGLAGSLSMCCGPGLCTTTYGVVAQYTDPSMIWSCLNIMEIKAQFGLFWVMYRLICDYVAITNKGIFGPTGEDFGHHCMGWQRLKVKTEVGTNDTDFCGPPPVYGPPCIYSRDRVCFVSHCKARVLCIPRVGLMVSYFWSPEHVSGDGEGGMPP
ncbi:hypothetical protein Hanom_Chr03g00184341 [Helianthus anomalus]